MISKNKKCFLVASLITIAIISLFSHLSRHGFKLLPVIGVSAFLILIYYSLMNAYKNYQKAIAYAFILSALFQIYLAFQFIGVESDVNNQYNAAKVIEKNGNIYADVNSYYSEQIYDEPTHYYRPDKQIGKNNMPWNIPDYVNPPTWAYISYISYQISKLISVKFTAVVKFPMILSTLIIGFLLYKTMKYYKKNSKETYSIVAMYLFNPLTLMISGYHGQVDNLGIVFLVVLLYYLLVSKKISSYSTLLLGLSLIIKPVTAAVIPYFLSIQKKIKGIFLLFILTFTPYFFVILTYPNASFLEIMNILARYSGVKYLWGYSRIESYLTSLFGLQWLHENFRYVYLLLTILMFAVMLAYFIKNKKVKYLDGILVSYLFFFAMSSGFGIQYLIWALPFIVLKAGDFRFKPLFYTYTLFGSLAALFFYYGEANLYYFVRDVIGFSFFGMILWISIIYWLIWYIKIGVKINRQTNL